MEMMRKLNQRRLINARKPAGRFGRLLIWAMNMSHHQMTDWGLSHVSIGQEETLLDIGCGGGGTIHKLAEITAKGKVYGVDFSEESVRVSRMTNRDFIQMGRVEIQEGSVSHLPFSDSLFDLVTAVNTHNYWPDLVNDLHEVHRVLKPDGTLVTIGSMYKGGKYEQRSRQYAEWIELTFPGINELRELFISAGYCDVQTFEKSTRGWFCALGRKPLP